jgi:nickel-dependent lactate racemase
MLAWYGDTEVEIDLPEAWDVTVCKHRGDKDPSLDEAGFRRAFEAPIGTPRIREGAKGKKEICILFDDLSRATPVAEILPYVLEELAAAGLRDEQIRFVAAIGAHGPMTTMDFTKKLGQDVLARFPVYNHNPFQNCVPLGPSRQGIPMEFNAEVLRCDYKIGIGSIVPHGLAGFGGGSKIILPGVASIRTIDLNHSRLCPHPTVGIGKYDGNILRADMDEAAYLAGLDVKVDCIFNLRRKVTHLFVGDFTQAHARGTRVAQQYWATDRVEDCDIVIANCYAKADEINVATHTTSLLKKEGGDFVLLVVTPRGQVVHYRSGSFGTDFGGPGFKPRTGLPNNTKRLTIMQPYPDYVGAGWIAPRNQVNFTRSWKETVDQLSAIYGANAKVAVVPDATVQYFP